MEPCRERLLGSTRARHYGTLSHEQGQGKRAATASGAGAPAAALPPPSGVVTTSLLLGNLHCPTCVSTIKDALRDSCAGHVRWVSPNVVTSVVTVEHDPEASVAELQQALEDAGFEVCGVTTSAGDEEVPDLNFDPVGISPEDIFGQASALRRLLSPSQAMRKPKFHSRAEAHLHNCEQCRTAKNSPGGTPGGFDGPDDHKDNRPSQIVVAGPSNSTGPATGALNSPTSKMSTKSFLTIESDVTLALHRATLAIGGMTCAACVNTISQNLSKKDWISNVVINLVNNSAVVDFYEKDRADELVEAIEDLGYEATLDNVSDLSQDTPRRSPNSDNWRASLAIGGMTCASCANTITKEMKKRDWVKGIAVNLVSNSATVDFEGRQNADKIAEAIEDIGYDAHLDSVVNFAQEQAESHRRTVEIQIDGFYCRHCPTRILQSLAGFRRELEVIGSPTMEKPRIKISYVPGAPIFTIRQILAAIEASDPEFRASIHHPPTLEERSKLIQRKHQQDILLRAIGTGIICVPTLVIGVVYMSLVHDDSPSKKFLMDPWTAGINRAQIALFIMATPVYFFAASIFHTRAIKEIRSLWRRDSRVAIFQRFYRFGSMNTLMSLGTTIAYVASVAQLIVAAVTRPEQVKDENFYFDSVVFLTFFLLLGRLIESYSKSRTGDAVEMLVKLRPSTAILVEGFGTDKAADVVLSADLLDFGDVVRIPNGTSPPSDGIIVQGESNFDESSLTGESRPVKKGPGEQVFAGTVNKDGPVLVRVTGTGGDSMLDQIVKLVREGQTKRAPLEQIADLLTTYFVPVITLIAILTWVIWMALGYGGVVPREYLDVTSGGWAAFSLQFAIAVFVVACPCGLALAAPTAIFVGGGLAAKYGILAKGGGEAFETASKVECVVFDKTGTLTLGGEPTVTDSEIFPNSEDVQPDELSVDVLSALKVVEENSSHPVAKAIVSFCTAQIPEKTKVQISDLVELPGKGMKAVMKSAVSEDSFEFLVGNEALMTEFSVAVSPGTAETLDKWKREAKSIALAAIRTQPASDTKSPTTSQAWRLAAALSISDPIRPEAPAVVRALQKSGTRVWMLSGDNPTTAAAVAAQIGIPLDQVIAGVLPAEKAAKIKYLQSTLKARAFGGREHTTRRAVVAMVGDGINDSPALATADVGVAIGSGSDVAISSAAFVLVKNDLRSVPLLLQLSRAIFRRVALNFGWALIYNVLAVPLAAGVLYPLVSHSGEHIRLDPVWASLAMALSSISVVLSSLALRLRFPVLGFRPREVEG